MVRKRELTFGVVVLLIATAAYLLGWTNLFTVKAIEIKGSPNAQITAIVMRASEVNSGQKMARVEPRSIATRLNQSGIDWLESVEISRNWLTGKVEISLKARKPVAYLANQPGNQPANQSATQYVDQTGAVFTSPIGVKEVLPELSALTLQSRARALLVYEQLPLEFRARVSKIIASSQENYQFILKDGLKIIWGSARDGAVKAKIYNALRALPENKKIKLMDLSDPTKPSVK